MSTFYLQKVDKNLTTIDLSIIKVLGYLAGRERRWSIKVWVVLRGDVFLTKNQTDRRCKIKIISQISLRVYAAIIMLVSNAIYASSLHP